MANIYKWRIAHLGGNRELFDELISKFNQAYKAYGNPAGMAIFSHGDTQTGRLMTVSITPEAIPYCPFSDGWEEHIGPQPFGNMEWVAGDVTQKPKVSEFPPATH